MLRAVALTDTRPSALHSTRDVSGFLLGELAGLAAFVPLARWLLAPTAAQTEEPS